MKRFFALILVAVMLCTLVGCASNQAATPVAEPAPVTESKKEAEGTEKPDAVWPKSAITVICPSSAGGGTDNTIRAFTDTWSKQIGQNVIVTNYDATPVAMQACVDADPDGYTVVCHQNTAICQYVTGVLDINPAEDYELVAALQYMGEQALIVPADAPFNDFSEFIAYAKEHPGEVSVAIATGGPAQFLWGQVMNECGVDLNMVVAANTTDKLTNISGGFIDCGQVDISRATSWLFQPQVDTNSQRNGLHQKRMWYQRYRWPHSAFREYDPQDSSGSYRLQTCGQMWKKVQTRFCVKNTVMFYK